MTDIIQDADNTPAIAQTTTDTPVTDKTAPVDENNAVKAADATPTIQDAPKTTKSKTTRKNTVGANTTSVGIADASASGHAATDNNTSDAIDTANIDTVKAPATNTVISDVISVTNGWHDDLFETATGTLLPAGKTTEIKVTHKANRERILRNLAQINLIHGKKLTVN